mmetsp:Transcript_28246/g.89966  ORF Transcript_28246/g.89966 Transcript_28246/m.89966 type:complete len:113 (-) Transcript_28246:336-674(-)
MALALLGKWEAAAKDLRAACSLDYDEEANTQLKFVDPKAKRISDHRLAKERAAKEAAANEAAARRAKAQAEYEAAKARDSMPGMGGGMPGMGGGMPDMSSMAGLMNDPECAK